jgi:hypothetical protein
MATERKALIIHHASGQSTESVDGLTAQLNDGWRLVSTSAMGGAGGATAAAQFAALVILAREEEKKVGGFSH